MCRSVPATSTTYEGRSHCKSTASTVADEKPVVVESSSTPEFREFRYKTASPTAKGPPFPQLGVQRPVRVSVFSFSCSSRGRLATCATREVGGVSRNPREMCVSVACSSGGACIGGGAGTHAGGDGGGARAVGGGGGGGANGANGAVNTVGERVVPAPKRASPVPVPTCCTATSVGGFPD